MSELLDCGCVFDSSNGDIPVHCSQHPHDRNCPTIHDATLIQCIHDAPFCPATKLCACICKGCQYYNRLWLQVEADRMLREAMK